MKLTGDLAFNTSLKAESNESTGDLVFKRMPASSQILTDPFVDKIRTTELAVGIRYNPGQTYMNTKQPSLASEFRFS